MSHSKIPKQIRIEVPRTSRIFQCGEPAEFRVSVLDDDGNFIQKKTLEILFQNDFHSTISQKTVVLSKQEPVRVTEYFEKPTFLTLKASCDTYFETAGVGIEPEKIIPGEEMQEDFLAFWKSGINKQNSVKLPVRLEEIPSQSTNSMTIFRVTVPTLDNEFRYGWLAVPKKMKGPFPALIMVPGAGAGSGPVRSKVSRGTVVLMMNVFPYPVDLNPNIRHEQFNAFEREKCGGRRYVWKNAENRETYFHRNSILAVNHAVNFLASLPEIDSDRIGFIGVSQGGFYGLALGALNSHLSGIVASIPGYCDHGAAILGRSPGGSKLYENAGTPNVRNVGPYFDGVNFARFVKTPIRMTVGFRDPISNPSTVFAAFNQIPAFDKKILCETLLGHETREKHLEAQAWLREKLDIPD